MLQICFRPERVRPKLPAIQGIRANLVYIVSLQLGITVQFQKKKEVLVQLNLPWHRLFKLKLLNDQV